MALKPSRYGIFYGCTEFPDCTATHGAHKDGTPLGIPANAETKKWRIEAHKAFDKLWKNGGCMSRKQAYRHLRERMNLTAMECHIGRFDISQCKRVIECLQPPKEGVTSK